MQYQSIQPRSRYSRTLVLLLLLSITANGYLSMTLSRRIADSEEMRGECGALAMVSHDLLVQNKVAIRMIKACRQGEPEYSL